MWLMLTCTWHLFPAVNADIQAGQGLYYSTLSKTYRAKDCNANTFGVANTTYGLTPAPCRECLWLSLSAAQCILQVI